MQTIFGSGVMFATPLTDATGAAIANPTPIIFGASQDVSMDISFETKTLHGQNQFPLDIGRGKGKVSGKVKNAQVIGRLWNNIVFGQTLASGILSDTYDTTGAAIPTTPFQITPTVPGAGTWIADLGVRNAAGLAMTRVASAPATGQYSVAAGVYTFAAADTALIVFISYQYTATSTSAVKQTVQNVPMGYAPSFKFDFYSPRAGKSLIFTFNKCIASKFGLATKLDDFTMPEFDFDAFDDGTGNVFSWATTE